MDSNIERQGPITATFQITYSGRAYNDGTIEVEELATIVRAVGQLVRIINERVNNDSIGIIVRLKAVEKGSTTLVFILEATASLIDTVAAIGAAQKVQALGNVVSMLADGASLTGTLFSVIKFLGGRPPKEVEKNVTYANGNYITINNYYNNTKISDDPTLDVATKPDAIKAGAKIVSPLKTGKADDIFISTGPTDDLGEHIKEEDLSSFSTRHLSRVNQEPSTEQVREEPSSVDQRLKLQPAVANSEHFAGVFTIAEHPNGSLEGEWIFGGARQFSARIVDESFLQNVRDSGIRLEKGDMLEIEVVVNKGKDKYYYMVTRVINHFKKVATT
jgi:hypothetical protein